MSSSSVHKLDSAEWVEDLQRKVFEECITQVQESIYPFGRVHGEFSTEFTDDVPISMIISNIHQSFCQLPHFRKRTDFLNELSKSLQMVAHEKREINWFEFRESSEHWFFDLLSLIREDSNNNIHSNHSGSTPDRLEKEALRGELDAGVNDDYLCSLNQMDTMASCYSLNSSSLGIGTNDSTVESSEDTDQINEDVHGIDLKVRFRRYNEENANLRDELARAEDSIMTLENDLKLTQKSLDKMTDKCTRLRRDMDDHRNLLSEAERREESCKVELRKLEKSYLAMQKKVEKLESEKEIISNLKSKLEEIKQENSDLIKQISEYKTKCDEKSFECKYLQEENDELHNLNIQLEKTYEKNIKDHLEKIQELQNYNEELQAQNLNMNKSDNSSQFSLTPPPYNQANIHSTPYKSRRKSRTQDSLFSELKASGFNTEDSKVQELLHEISLYNNEIANISEQLDEALKEIAAWKNEICSPSVQLVEPDTIQSLKHKITTLLSMVKTWMKDNPSPSPAIKKDYSEKPDVLPATKKFGDDHSLDQDEKDSDLVESITSPKPLIAISGLCFDKTASLLPESTLNAESNKTPEDQEEIIVPIVEALNRIISLKETEDAQTDNQTKRTRLTKKKSIYTSHSNDNLRDLESRTVLANPFARGDGPHLNHLKFDTQSNFKTNPNMKTLKSEFKEYNPSPDDAVSNIDSKFITMRQKTFLINHTVDSTTSGKSEVEPYKFNNDSPESYCSTPVNNPKCIPRRKLSVYNRSFDIDTLQTPINTPQITTSDKKRSASTPDVQEPEFANFSKSIQPLKTPPSKNHLLTTYRNHDDSFSSASPSPKKEMSLMIAYDSPAEMPVHISKKPMILAPTKFKVPDSTVNLTSINSVNPLTATNNHSSLENESSYAPDLNIAAQQSKIISGSSDLLNHENVSTEANSHKTGETFDVESSNHDNNFKNTDKKYGTYIVEDLEEENKCEESAKPSSTTTATTTTTATISPLLNAVSTTDAPSSNSSIPPSGATSSGSAILDESQQSEVVGRAMSSGEDSSADSEPGGEKDSQKPLETKAQDSSPILDKKSPIITRQRSNSCTEVVGPKEANKVEPLRSLNGDAKKDSEKVAVAPTQEVQAKENESPKAFPSWTDEKLKECGIANYPDIDSELSENLSEEELKKKYSAFSVGLSTDRMTLSKRIILSRRHRDQAEKNFNNEVHKMQQDIKDLAPLCVDSESVERVERVRQQLDMVSRCAHRISCTAETLGAVHQERRVSRAVLLADKYLQTLRSKCEKLASELAETKKILAENNIVLEDNLSEMGDDVPRVRYRAVPNNNRTMMARRRASIATISRPLMGSNQDISKEVPRQRNSVSGRVPGIRRPSLCYETPKWEAEKLDRADSSSSITELREIFEQAESRRQSREENNNSIRASVNNLSTLNNLAVITSENTEEEDVWSNMREDIVPESTIENEIKPFELSHRYTCHYITWFTERYSTWKTILIVVFIIFTIFLMNRVVSSSERKGPPASWWSFEEILNQYIQVETNRYHLPRPI